jgi:hypothetical protein
MDRPSAQLQINKDLMATHQIAVEQFLGIGVIRWARQFPNRFDGCLQMIPRHTGINALKQGGGILRLIKDDLSGFTQDMRCCVQVMDRAQAFLLPFPRGLRGGRSHKRIKEV